MRGLCVFFYPPVFYLHLCLQSVFDARRYILSIQKSSIHTSGRSAQPAEAKSRDCLQMWAGPWSAPHAFDIFFTFFLWKFRDFATFFIFFPHFYSFSQFSQCSRFWTFFVIFSPSGKLQKPSEVAPKYQQSVAIANGYPSSNANGAVCTWSRSVCSRKGSVCKWKKWIGMSAKEMDRDASTRNGSGCQRNGRVFSFGIPIFPEAPIDCLRSVVLR